MNTVLAPPHDKRTLRTVMMKHLSHANHYPIHVRCPCEGTSMVILYAQTVKLIEASHVKFHKIIKTALDVQGRVKVEYQKCKNKKQKNMYM